MINDLLRTPLKNSHAYVAGGQINPRMFDDDAIRLNANENQMGPSPLALKAMEKELKNGHLYPMNVWQPLKEKLAAFYGVEVENITLFNGSGAAINAMGDMFLNPDDEVVISSPTYMAYAPLPARFDAKIVEVSSREGLYTDLDAIYDGITDKTKLIFICNPNNPTGTILDNKELDEFMERLPENIICIVDEAYFDWIDIPDYKSAMRFINKKNVIVLRTFSKIYGMAGIRMGVSVANAEITAALKTASDIYYSNRIAGVGALAAIDDIESYEAAYQNNVSQRKYISDMLTEMGADVTPSQTSFIYFNPHTDNKKCIERLAEKKIFIRPFEEPYLRVSIGLPEQNQKFLDAMREILTN